ncbi:hypothetical protein SDC9_150427 [bioreactor metagenome]|uniref:Uncharacterized protein n=1 Tax=bioreactor metagenome TaxID=1076179 RepID=A0A645EMG3_9ZZZZ
MLCAFDQRHQIAHAQDSGRHAFRVERFKVFQFFALTRKFDRLSGYGTDRQRSPTASVPVQFGQDDTGYAELFIEGLRYVDGILTGHRVYRKQDLGRIYCSFDVLQLCHQYFIHVQSSRRIDDDQIASIEFGLFNGLLRYIDRICFRPQCVDREIQLFAQSLQLVDCCRTVNVGCDQQRALVLFFLHVIGKLSGSGGLTSPLQADHHYDGRWLGRKLEWFLLPAHQFRQLFVDDFDDLLCR